MVVRRTVPRTLFFLLRTVKYWYLRTSTGMKNITSRRVTKDLPQKIMQTPLIDAAAQQSDEQTRVASVDQQVQQVPTSMPTPSGEHNGERGKSVVLWLLMSISFTDAVEYGIIMPSLYPYIRSIADGMSPSVLQQNYGIVLAAFSFASMCCKPWIGAWCDARSFKEVYGVTYAVAIAGNLIYTLGGLWGSWYYLLIGRLLSGVGAANSALGPAYIGRTVDPSQRTAALSQISLAFPLGLVVGPAVNAITAAINLKIGSFELDDKNSPGALLVIVQSTQLLLLLLILPEPPPYSQHARASAALHGWCKSMLMAMCQMPVIGCSLIVFTWNFLIGASEALVVPITSHAFHFTPLQNSFVYMGIAVLIIFGNVLVLKLSVHPLASLMKLERQLNASGLTELATTTTDLKSALASSRGHPNALVEWSRRANGLADAIAAQDGISLDSETASRLAQSVRSIALHPPRRSRPRLGDRTMVLLSCVVYLGVAAYVLLCFTWDMPVWRYLLGQLLLLVTVPFVFAPNRAYFTRQIDDSVHQGLLNSLLSVLASLGGVLGPIWLGASIGEPAPTGPVARLTFIGCAALVLVTMLIFAVTTIPCRRTVVS